MARVTPILFKLQQPFEVKGFGPLIPNFQVVSGNPVWSASTDWTLSNNNFTALRTGTAVFWAPLLANIGGNVLSFTANVDAIGSSALVSVGFSTGGSGNIQLGGDLVGFSIGYQNNGTVEFQGNPVVSGLATWTTADAVRVDKNGSVFSFYKGSTLQTTWDAVGNPVAGFAYPAATDQHGTGLQLSLTTVAAAAVAHSLTADTGAFALSGQAMTPAVTMSAATGTFTLTGTAATLAVTISASTGAFTLTGNAALLKAARIFSLATGTFTLTGNAATLAAGMSAGTGSFVLAGQSATLAASMPAATGAFILTGNSATLPVRMTAAVGAFALSGQAATLAVTIPALTGSFALTGRAATLTKTGANSITAVTASFALTGYAASLLAARRLAAIASSFSLTGSAASLGVTVPMSAGAFALTGYPGIFKRALIFSAAGQTFVLRGFDAILDHEGKSVTYPLAGIAQPYPGTAASYPLTTAQAYPLTQPQTYPLEGIPQQYPLAS